MTNEFVARLPSRIAHHVEQDVVEMYRATAAGLYYIETGDPCCSPEMSWDSWVAFARQIIAADEAARAGGAA
ncbi:hypothetical protein [Rhizobium sp. BK456]|uniref:hypothetical protein n=1 Tax=Rhizobium sp. BK456 TaxID=2587007 RepID=UPI001610E043|nr:hypothetical protein [Rhizobium sp. BK456]MBB3520985.1 hypothetical protein [Rhizobium sp. BK456]